MNISGRCRKLRLFEHYWSEKKKKKHTETSQLGILKVKFLGKKRLPSQFMSCVESKDTVSKDVYFLLHCCYGHKLFQILPTQTVNLFLIDYYMHRWPCSIVRYLRFDTFKCCNYLLLSILLQKSHTYRYLNLYPVFWPLCLLVVVFYPTRDFLCLWTQL